MGRIVIEGTPYHIDNFRHYLGRVVGISDWLKIDQKRINDFGRATIDMNRIHVDPEWAKVNSPFGGIVAHGFLTVGLMTHLSQSAGMVPDGVDYGINLGFERLRFLAPVAVNHHVRLKATAVACVVRGSGRWTFKCRCNIEVRETEKVALGAVRSVLFINTKQAGITAGSGELAEAASKA
ncbi:MAG: MaoC/PaaZ C-terminal domain-containing protein [Alphaproteobacteria bacterium]